MKDMGLIMREAHKMTREIKAEYKEVDYKFQLGLCISYLLNERVEEKMELKELKGTEKQVKWANDIREKTLEFVAENKRFAELEALIQDVEEAKFFIENLKVMTSQYANFSRKSEDCECALKFLKRKKDQKDAFENAKERGIILTDDMLKARTVLIDAKRESEQIIEEAKEKDIKVRKSWLKGIQGIERMLEIIDEGKLEKNDCEEILLFNEAYQIRNFVKEKFAI